MNGNLLRALHKIEKYSGKEWCGCLTPSEWLALLDDGAQPVESNKYLVEYAKEKMARGESNPSWYYFTLGKTKPIIRKHDKSVTSDR